MMIKTCYVHFSGFQASTKYKAQCLEERLGATARDLENHRLLQYKPSAPRWARRKDSQFLSSKKQTVVVLPTLTAGTRREECLHPEIVRFYSNRESIKQAGASE